MLDCLVRDAVRHDWSLADIETLFKMPLLDLVFKAAELHRDFHNPREIQICSLLSIKTGACPEDCAYCPQSAHHNTELEPHRLLELEQVKAAAQNAKNNGAARFCMGAAWRNVKDNNDFERVLEMVRAVKALDLEVCCTLGMLTEDQAVRLKEAGVYAYNHNLDTSREFYSKIISTRDYDDRLDTLKNVRKAGMTVCCGGIIGMGEQIKDRMELLHTLCSLTPHPESVPINALVSVKGTSLESQPPVDNFEFIRMVAAARILMPKSRIRLSAGRMTMSKETQALCFLAGANSIFAGDKLLTTANPDHDLDSKMFASLGLNTVNEAHSSEQLKQGHTESGCGCH